MHFYEQQYERYCLREYIGMWHPNIPKAVIYWILIKLNSKRLNRKPFPVFRSVRANQIELDQVPEKYRAAISEELNLLFRYDFVDPLLSGVISGSSLNELRQTGVCLISRHKNGNSAVSVIIDYHDGRVTRRSNFIFTFISDPPGDITTSNGRFMCYSDPGGENEYYPKVPFEKLVHIHNQRILSSNRDFLPINDNEDLVRLTDGRLVKSIDELIRRGILKYKYSE
ncbi:hypothetical protein V6x_48240 [Gimesia chilikensis]|uniref:Uncharacterized protein n=1 Tax=Gimesia chilikensis TaxID=2605989 RepID=A0A517WIK8_9PLAN|nr:hypothetical protein [Gimesia chilikensis]QDU05091.1 hypothetical protein V6x_48240 [Gimesia chilikensis]